MPSPLSSSLPPPVLAESPQPLRYPTVAATYHNHALNDSPLRFQSSSSYHNHTPNSHHEHHHPYQYQLGSSELLSIRNTLPDTTSFSSRDSSGGDGSGNGSGSVSSADGTITGHKRGKAERRGAEAGKASASRYRNTKKRKTWSEESQLRRNSHALSDARRRAAITLLQSTLVRIVRTRTGVEALTTQQALERAVEMLTSENSSTRIAEPPITSTDALSELSGYHPSYNNDMSHTAVDVRRLLSDSGLGSPAPSPLTFVNSHLRQLSALMEYALQHYTTGASFNPSLPSFRPTRALHSFLSGGGICAVRTFDLRILDTSHENTALRLGEVVGHRPEDCTLRLSDSETEPGLTYDDLARKLAPVMQPMTDRYNDGSNSSDTAVSDADSRSVVELAQSVLVEANYRRYGQKVRSLKLLTLVCHADRRPPVMLGVQFSGTIYPI